MSNKVKASSDYSDYFVRTDEPGIKERLARITIPETMCDGHWTVGWLKSPGGMALRSERMLGVNGYTIPETRFMGLHELGHIRYSPSRFPKVSSEMSRAIGAVEDARIHLRLARADNSVSVFLQSTHPTFDDTPDKEPYPIFVTDLNSALQRLRDPSSTISDYYDIGLLRVARHGLGVEEYMQRLIDSAPANNSLGSIMRFAVKQALRVLGSSKNKRPSFAYTYRAALAYMEAFTETLGCSMKWHEQEDGLAYLRLCLRDPATRTSARAVADSLKDIGLTPGWGELVNLRSLKMRHRTRRRRWSKSTQATDSGSIPRFFERILVDQAVFSKPSKKNSGTVLIDFSGSVSLMVKELRAIVEATGGATVVLYFGNQSQGWLRTVAKDGLTATWSDRIDLSAQIAESVGDSYHSAGRRNAIDGLALKWLSKQPGPRYWISDCRVSGRGMPDSGGGCLTNAMLQECLDTCIGGTITAITSSRLFLKKLGVKTEL